MTPMMLRISMYPFKKMFALKRVYATVASTMTIAATLLSAPAFADPFRSDNPRSFDNQLESAFNAMFTDGNYVEARELLESASTSDPMTHAMQAAFAYLESDWSTLGAEAEQTLTAAQQLTETDELRGNLYTAVGHFMEGAHTLSTQGTVQATPIVLNKLRLVFDHLGKAEEVDPQDPELNLIKGYMDLMLAVNLPFSSPDQAIERLQSYGAPSYLVQRGLAIAYRDLDNPGAALTAVDQAIAETPNNPDLYYLKAQILRLNDNLRQSLRNFERALEQSANYPTPLAEQIAYEMCRTRNDFHELNRNCRNWAERYVADSVNDDDALSDSDSEARLEDVTETDNQVES